MPTALLPRSDQGTSAGPAAAPRRRTRVLALAEARWAAAATVAFLIALPLQLTGAASWLWGALYAVAYVAGGWEPALAGLRALREKTLDVDLLMIVAALGAASIGQVMDGALLIVIFATSGALEALATARTADSVRSLLDLAPTTATRVADGGGEETVDTAELKVGDVILVRPGERVGADGEVLDGASDVDQATITGEPLPVAKEAGDEVFAGTLNGAGALRVRVGRDASDSVIARIVAMVEEASETKAPTQLFIEKIEQRYSLGMVVATLAVFAVPLALGDDLTGALLRAMTFMIVASPCAVVLATMPPLLSAIANAGRHGVLVKSAVVMERLGQVDAVALDKTGTLTEGTPRVTAVHALPGSGLTDDTLLTLAAAAEHRSEHPLARAVVSAARARGLEIPAVADFASAPGIGVSATVGGAVVRVGAPARLLTVPPTGEPQDTASTEALARARQWGEDGQTAVLVLRDGAPVGVLGIADRLRPDAATTVTALESLTGTAPMLLTGDNAQAAARLATEVGIDDVRAGLLPQDKVAAVREAEGAGRKVLVIGDGVNDAPALAAAHTGIAMGRAGSDLALETADAVIVRDELATVPRVIALSRRARGLVVQNLVIAGAFIAVLVTWDLAGNLPLPLGVLGHEGSTVLVGLNGLRLLREGAWRDAGE
ncbi:heavy metal translocating P-type ATPase [Streptomyces sp. BA2]|uniref:heavy metal translocating P-type ATPase n=1 Tax=Streptomyces sp. BA2 TaxID=436595 RepID=UPI00132B30AD|nr:heavy metal translocating P-type ATPase [Streptomyces sp. BA2]MWA15336.1 heavy metal translocating P-type ATPase [Streptomyces sp. BA2]